MKNTVIIVDDDSASVAQLTKLVGATHSVRSTSSSDQALSWLENDLTVKCIIVEQQLRKTRGLDVLKRAAAVRPEVRRVLATRYSELAEIVQGVHGGIIHRIIAKPFNAAEVQRALAPDLVHIAAAGPGMQAAAAG